MTPLEVGVSVNCTGTHTMNNSIPQQLLEDSVKKQCYLVYNRKVFNYFPLAVGLPSGSPDSFGSKKGIIDFCLLYFLTNFQLICSDYIFQSKVEL